MEFVNFELAKKLKDLGYNVPFFFFYRTDDQLLHHAMVGEPLVYGKYVDNEVVIAPTISQILKWLSEKYSIHISTKPYPCEDGLMWLYEIRKFNEYISIVKVNKTGFIKEEQAALDGIEYTLDNLI
jgi:5'(3')-deoxyribonucleotidase